MNRPFRLRRSGVEPEDIPIDLAYLEAQVPELAKTRRHVAHYHQYGLRHGLDPTPFFLTDWYSWQNPDWRQSFRSPYLHYLGQGLKERRDPSPFVDITRFLEMTEGAVPPDRAYNAILAGLRAPAMGVYESEGDLVACQRRFIQGVSLCVGRMAPPVHPRRALVVCQAGRGARLDRWAGSAKREWDLMLNHYDAAGMHRGVGEYVLFQKGTKFTAMKLLIDRFPELFAAYEHVLFLDDDIETTAADLNALFSACRRHGLDLAQMSLSQQSACNWTHLYSRPGRSEPRKVSAVEIMMPVFSRRALEWIMPTLGRSVSGFGLDLVWGHLVSQKGGRIAVLDDVVATHARPVDQAGGAYYRYLRQNGINAKAELWSLLKRYGASRDVLTV